MSVHSLIIVGTGIKFLAHLTTESRACIERSQVVLYLVNDPVMKEWIKKSNVNSISMDNIYFSYVNRSEAYAAITNYIIEILEVNAVVCVVMYGHPTMYAEPALNAAIKAKEKGYRVQILPAISAEACLFADLLIDPGSVGCQSYEVTDFLLYKRQASNSSHLILWQIGIIGQLNHDLSTSCGIEILVNYLNKNYPLGHEVFLYEAAQYPGFQPKIEKIALGNLPLGHFSKKSTLYIPPINNDILDREIFQKLLMNK